MLHGCGDVINYYDVPHGVDPSLLTEYNAILHSNLYGPICGSAIVKSNLNGAYAVTASHCVIGTGDSFSLENNNGDIYPATVIAVDATSTDLALLHSKEFPVQEHARISASEPELGETVWTSGYGAGIPDSLTKGIVSKLDCIGHMGRPMNMFDITSWYGNSGGGIYSDDGKLVGTVSQFGPQFDAYGPETGWIYGCTVEGIRNITGDL